MNLSKIVSSVAVIAALAFAPTPAFAQHGGGHGGGARIGGGSRGVARAALPRGGYATGTAVPRGGYYGGGYGRYGGYGYGYGYGGFGYALAAPYYAFSARFALGFGLYVGYPVAYPYWAFPYPYVYGYPYPYPYGYGYPAGYSGYPTGYSGYPVSGYPAGSQYPGSYPTYGGAPLPGDAPNAVAAAPGSGTAPQGQMPAQGQYGGLSFQITPATAQVHVDGVYVGTVGQFSATTQPLTLTPGKHHLELRADGYQAMALDVNVAPGQVIPYQGTMQAQ